MPGTRNEDHLRRRRNELNGGGHFIGGAEGIGGAVNEQCRHLYRREMSGAELIRFRGRVQGIRQQEQPVASLRIFRGQERGLTAAVGMTACKDSFAEGAQCVHGCRDTHAILSGAAWMRRSKRTAAAEGKIETQHDEACGAESIRDSNQQRSSAISACAMRDCKAGAGVFGGTVKESANG